MRSMQMLSADGAEIVSQRYAVTESVACSFKQRSSGRVVIGIGYVCSSTSSGKHRLNSRYSSVGDDPSTRRRSAIDIEVPQDRSVRDRRDVYSEDVQGN